MLVHVLCPVPPGALRVTVPVHLLCSRSVCTWWWLCCHEKHSFACRKLWHFWKLWQKPHEVELESVLDDKKFKQPVMVLMEQQPPGPLSSWLNVVLLSVMPGGPITHPSLKHTHHLHLICEFTFRLCRGPTKSDTDSSFHLQEGPASSRTRQSLRWQRLQRARHPWRTTFWEGHSRDCISEAGVVRGGPSPLWSLAAAAY